MKAKTIKALVLALCAVLLVVSTVFVTMAYLTSTTDVVHNTFTVGNVQITLDEAKVTEYGVEVAGAERVTENEYRLIPGHTYTKDPTVTVIANSEACYVFTKVTITNFATLQQACGNNTLLPQDFIGNWNPSVWESISYDVDENGNAVCWFAYATSVARNKTANTTLPALFTSIALPGYVEYFAGLENVKVDVTAYAIQADGFASSEAAFTAGGWN